MVTVFTLSWRSGVAFCSWLEPTTSLRRVQSFVDAFSDKDNVTFQDSRYFTASLSVGDAVFPSLRRRVSGRSKEDRENDPGRSRRTFTFGEGFDNRPSTLDMKGGKKKHICKGKGGGKKGPPPAWQWAAEGYW